MTEQETIYQWIKDGELEKALKALFGNIEKDPDTIENYINAGIVLADAGEIEKAERFFQRALTIDDKNGAVYYNLANLYYDQGRYREAIKLYQNASKYEMDQVDTNYMIGMSFNQLDAPKEAMPFLMTAAEQDQSSDAEVQFQYGLVLCHLEMFEQAIKQLSVVLAIDPKHVDALYNLGLATYMQSEDIDSAIAYFDKAIEIDSGHLLSQHAKATFEALKNEES
ncbi:tetratricopeptide repeat protein [Staphylococcus caledonicus]|uniref:tetratricopeptide repeat protein n=1 Tax=Staphylococcus caledonicus TaxID=2741333 RepID=UPI0018E4AD6A|nr:tetratricopeptide repeat protein [Staphylococcus caledonicus]MBI5972655.1 tetratricopeptide repeat protein [Staphylococcus caledonicus]